MYNLELKAQLCMCVLYLSVNCWFCIIVVYVSLLTIFLGSEFEQSGSGTGSEFLTFFDLSPYTNTFSNVDDDSRLIRLPSAFHFGGLTFLTSYVRFYFHFCTITFYTL